MVAVPQAYKAVPLGSVEKQRLRPVSPGGEGALKELQQRPVRAVILLQGVFQPFPGILFDSQPIKGLFLLQNIGVQHVRDLSPPMIVACDNARFRPVAEGGAQFSDELPGKGVDGAYLHGVHLGNHV